MISVLQKIPVANRDLLAMQFGLSDWRRKLIEIANSLNLGRCDGPAFPCDLTCQYLQVLAELDHPSEWIGDHHFEASKFVDQLQVLLIFEADPNAKLSNGRALLDVLTVENRYRLWKDVNENIPALVLLAIEQGALASPEAAKAMILPIYHAINPDHIDYETDLLNSRIDHSILDHTTHQFSAQAQARRL
ncbi:hypothetical protein [Xanthomonas cannabis]|uniref:hypothetical protein n=1 Tax=Xanthomonas cannabis TaxID=1885674 RepID=UPI001111AD85|nr:hypothetical protein [Xanthomonas cannabis]